MENGIHSFNKGIETLQEYENNANQNELLLKESIIFLHHGIELLLKQILINKCGEYLIFSDLRENTVKKIIQSKEKDISVFSISNPPRTITFLEAIERIRAFVDELQLDKELGDNLKLLNTLRNNIEHYGIDEEILKIEDLLLKIRVPITTLFKNGGISLWKEIASKFLVEASRLRNGGSIKMAKIIGKTANIEYVKNYDEYKKLQPQSLVTKAQYKLYWKTGNAILKALNEGSVRLLSKIDDLENVKIILPIGEYIYQIKVNRLEVEKYIGKTFEEIRNNWDKIYLDNYVYDEDGRNKFFQKFGSKLRNETKSN